MTGETRRNVAGLAIAIVVAGLILAGGYAIWYLFLRPAGPAAVGSTSVPVPSIAATVSPSTAAGASPSSVAGSSSAPATSGIDGTWKVDTSIASAADSTHSFVGYRVVETLASIGGNTAVGRTPNVSGTMTISGSTVTDVTIEGRPDGPRQ